MTPIVNDTGYFVLKGGKMTNSLWAVLTLFLVITHREESTLSFCVKSIWVFFVAIPVVKMII